ncbi:MAG: hypothetical protein LIO79_03200 [Rikenellaceae bacterium]|nr:hypothetical protein [Rikenellaceae bacterium]
MAEKIKKYLYSQGAEYILFFLAVIPVLIFRDFTPNNELKYLSIADEAIRDGNIFTFTNHGAAYADKPPLYIWIVMLGKLLLGKHSMLFLGMFSLVPSLVIVRIMDKWISGTVRPESADAGRIMLYTSTFFIGSAIVLRMDMLMCLFIVLALRTFYLMFTGEVNIKNRILFPVFLFFAVFTKGPVGILVPLLSTIVFIIIKGEWRTIGRYWGAMTWGILLILSGIWLGCVYLEGGTEYFNDLLFNQTVNRAVDSFHHKAPFYYYLETVWYIIAPWSLLIIGLVIYGCIRNKYNSLLWQFFLSVFVVTLMMLSLISAKIEIYFLPAIPFLAYLALPVLDSCEFNWWKKGSLALPAIIFITALPAVIYFGGAYPEVNGIMIKGAAGILTLSGITAIILIFKNNITDAVKAIGFGFLIAVFVGGFGLRQLENETGFGAMANYAKGYAATNGIERFYSYKIRSAENMDVYLGCGIGVIDREEQNPLSFIETPAVIFIRLNDFEQAKEASGSEWNTEIAGTFGTLSVVVIK